MNKSKWVIYHQPCVACQSSDAVSYNSKGWGTCFSCEAQVPPLEDGSPNIFDGDVSNYNPYIPEKGKDYMTPNGEQTYQYMSDRGISEKVYRKYKSITKFINGKPFERVYNYPNEMMQIRRLPKEGWRTDGDVRNAGLYGKNIFPPASYECIAISEGAEDAHAVYEMLDGRVASVSVLSAQSALREIQQDFKYLDSFKKIYLCLDNDAPGQKRVQDIINLFDFRKLYVVNMGEHKDPNSFLQTDEADLFRQYWASARRYSPTAVRNTFSDVAESLLESAGEKIGTYPFQELQDALYGLYRGHLVCFKGGEGIGKTETFRAIQNHLLKNHPEVRIGLIHLEEKNSDTIKAIATYHTGHPFVHPEDPSSPDEILKAYKGAVADDEDRVYFYTDFDVDDIDSFLANVRFLGSICDVLFLDHISWLAEGLSGDDERKRIATASQKLAMLAQQLDICIIMISHTNDDGKTLHSRNPSKVSHTVVQMDRDKTATFPEERNKMTYTIEKARKGGRTGPGGHSFFDTDSMTLKDYQSSDGVIQ